MNRQQLIDLIKEKRSYLCVGLDADPALIPGWLIEQEADPLFAFNKRIIDATIDLAVAYKPNMAFYESAGSKGWISLEKTISYLRHHPGKPVLTIADAKRGDIGNSSVHYAKAFFDTLGFDAITVSPYMGRDSISPFLAYKDKWTIILALTSNKGALDFQVLQPQLPMLLEKFGIKTCYWKKLYEVVMEESIGWGNTGNTMFVVGATQTDMLANIRENIPDHFFLVPGVGAQGGSLTDISRVAMNKDVGILVNVSRSILYASAGADFDVKAREVALSYQKQMEAMLKEKKICV